MVGIELLGVCEVEQNLGKGGEGSGVEVKIKSVMDNHRQQVDGERDKELMTYIIVDDVTKAGREEERSEEKGERRKEGKRGKRE